MSTIRPALCCLALLAACSHDSKPDTVKSGSEVSATTPPPPAAAPWQTQSAAFMAKLADAMEASQGDCPKLVVEIQKLAPDAQTLAATLKSSGHKFAEYTPEAALEARFTKQGNLLDRCENEKPPGFGEAMEATLLTVAPFEFDAKGADLGGVFAPH